MLPQKHSQLHYSSTSSDTIPIRLFFFFLFWPLPLLLLPFDFLLVPSLVVATASAALLSCFCFFRSSIRLSRFNRAASFLAAFSSLGFRPFGFAPSNLATGRPKRSSSGGASASSSPSDS